MSEAIELNDSTFAESIAKSNLALVDYYASWCGSCRMALPMFKRVAAEANMTLFKVDAENNVEARNAVTIENLPTLALVKDGKIIGSICTTREEGLKEFLTSHGILKG